MRRIELALAEDPPDGHKACSAIIQYCNYCEEHVDISFTNIIDVPGISFRTAGILESRGISTLVELLQMSYNDLLKIKGIAKTEAKNITDAISRIGKRLKD
jgi:DNA-directed RNA polymerase alpha subunit